MYSCSPSYTCRYEINLDPLLTTEFFVVLDILNRMASSTGVLDSRGFDQEGPFAK